MTKTTLLIPACIAMLVCATASPSYALKLTDSQLVQGAKQCTRYINRYERQYAIPTHLLSAIASNESGRYHKGLKILVPWPWTINVKGKGYYFKTKKEAVHAVKKYRARGIKSIDIGCMQVNLYHHAKAFRSIDEAFEPKYNVAYAANFLRSLYDDSKSWKKAAGHYHSKTSHRGRKYAGRVYSRWQKIIQKLRIAKINTRATTSKTVASASKPLAFKPKRKIARLPEQKGKKVASHRVPRMKVIELSKPKQKKSTVIVKPAIRVVEEPSTVTVANAEPATLRVTDSIQTPEVKAGGSGKVVHVNDLAPASGKSMPSFIFTN